MYEWDEAKRETNIRKHGLDFADAHRVYENHDKITFASQREDETRLIDMVKLMGIVLVLVYTERGDNIRVISFRRASRTERKRYGKFAEEQN